MSNWRIFTDGACSGNPGPGGWAAVISSPDQRVQEVGGAAENTTNNRMELTALIEALRLLPSQSKAVIFTDSKYVIEGATAWTQGWKRNGWMTQAGEPVKNQDLWKELDSLQSLRSFVLEWTYVPGHAGIPGNERVDEIAQSFSKGRTLELYEGPGQGYLVDLCRTKLEPSEVKPYPVYLSLVDNSLEEHTDWESCKKKVHGVAGARFKKVQSASERLKVLKDWGVSQ